MWTVWTIAAVLAAAFLGWNLYRRFGADRIASPLVPQVATAI